MKNIRRRIVAAAVGSALALGLSAAQGQSTPRNPKSSAALPTPMGAAVSAQDRKFITTAAEAGAAEVAMAHLAKDRAASADVKDFAARMMSDHEQAGDELMSIATARGVTPTDQPSQKDQAEIDRLGKMRGADFDKAYVKAQMSAHKDAVALFTAEAAKGKDAELKQFAASTLPTLQDHLQMVQQMSKATLQGNAQGKSTTAAKS